MKRSVVGVAIAIVCACACQKTTVPTATTDAAVVPETSTKPKTEPNKPELPPFDDKCTTDAECGAITIHTVGPDTCCSLGCGIGKGSKAWVDAVEAACKKTPHPECKDIQCDGPAPPFKPKCKDGRCTLTY